MTSVPSSIRQQPSAGKAGMACIIPRGELAERKGIHKVKGIAHDFPMYHVFPSSSTAA